MPNTPHHLEVRIPKVKDAQLSYDAHLLLEPPRPVPSDSQSAYARRQKWLERKEHLKVLLDMAREADRSQWRPCDTPEKYAGMIAPAPSEPAKPKRHSSTRKTAAERREKLASIMAALAKVDPSGPDAERFRNQAACERRMLRIAEETEAREREIAA